MFKDGEIDMQSASQSKDPFKFASYRYGQAHYLEFAAMTAGAVTEESIGSPQQSEKLVFSEQGYKVVKNVFRRCKRQIPASLAPDYIRLIFETKDKSERIIMDQFGVFRLNKEPSYQLEPLLYLLLHLHLEENANYWAKRLGVKRPFKADNLSAEPPASY